MIRLFLGQETYYNLLVTYAIFLMTFACLPTFILAIVGVINCVSSWNSSRYQPVEIRLARKLDFRFGFYGFLLIVIMVVYLIADLALEIEAYPREAHILVWIRFALSRLFDVLLILLPLSTTCVLGRRCCCWCCCKPCQPPIDDL